MSNIDAWKELEKWEDKNKSKCFLVVDEEDVKEMFNPKEIEGIDGYRCIEDVWNDYDLGAIFGVKIQDNLGVFAEGKYLYYWERPAYDFKFGLNYQFIGF